MLSPHPPRARLAVAGFALVAAFTAALEIAAGIGADAARDVDVKAALLYNFARFAEWPALGSTAPIAVCVVGDDRIADALIATVGKQRINDHALSISRPRDGATWRSCQMLFIADAEVRRPGRGVGGIRNLPVLTVSDGKGFARTGGIIELFVEEGRMRFAINIDAAGQAGLVLSSRLLGLAKIIRDVPAQ